MPKVQCGGCGRSFTPDAGRRLFCDHACYVASLRRDAAATFVTRFWAKVNQSDPKSCWLWQGATIKGYGQVAFRLPGVCATRYAHRVSWELAHGPVPAGLHVCHTCDTPRCVNPNHLFLGTPKANLEDARRKGRLRDGAHLIKVTDAQVEWIKGAYRPRQNGRLLAAQFGISLTHLLRLVNGSCRVPRPMELTRADVDLTRRVDLPLRGEVA